GGRHRHGQLRLALAAGSEHEAAEVDDGARLEMTPLEGEEEVAAPLGGRLAESAQGGLLVFEGADIDLAVDDAGEAALVGGGHPVGGAGAEGGAAGEQGHRLGGPAVVAQWCQAGVDGGGGGADEVAVNAVNQAGQTAAVADQVVVAWVGGPEEVRSGGRGVGGDDRVVQGQADVGGAGNAAAEFGRRVAGDRAVAHHHSAG